MGTATTDLDGRLDQARLDSFRDSLDAADLGVDELTAVADAAHKLAFRLDVDGLLVELCARSRELTHADLVHIMLVDEESGDIFMRAVDGARTEDFAQIRLTIGTGLGGKVIAEGRSFSTDNYTEDPALQHDAIVDDLAIREEIRAALGVPLRVGDSIRGALFAAFRSERTFEPRDQSFLEAIAAHAAVALTNAELHDRTLESLERERTLHAIARRQAEALEQLAALHARLTELALGDHTTETLLDGIGDALGRPVRLTSLRPGNGRLAVSVGPRSSRLGWLRFDDTDDHPAEHQVRGLEQAARIVAMSLLRDRAVMEAEYRNRGALLEALLEAEPAQHPELIRRGAQLGIKLDSPLSVALLSTASSDDAEILARVASELHRMAPGSLAAAGKDGVVILAPDSSPKQFAEKLAGALLRRLEEKVTIAIHPTAVMLDDLMVAITDVRDTARGAAALGLEDVVVDRATLGSSGYLMSGGDELQRFAQERLRPLLDYDNRRDTGLLETLDAYLRHSGNAAETARHLCIHVNTLYYRLSRIAELTDRGLADSEARFELELALRVARLSGLL